MTAPGGGTLVQGSVEPGFGAVRDAFAEVVAHHDGTGAAVAAWHDGRWVVDLWGGYADAACTRVWQRDDVVMPYSVSKPFAALPALLLVDQGRLDLDAPLRRVWPELTADATLRQVLCHQAGVVALDAPAPTEAFFDWDDLCRRIAAQPPAWPPGTAQGESALFFGHLAGEPARRVGGRSVGAVLADEVARPLGLDVAFGLDAERQRRAVELTGTSAYLAERLVEAPELYRRAVSNPPGAFDEALVGSARWRGAEVPAVNLHGTARGVAGLYAALESGRLLSADLRREMSSPQSNGIDLVVGHDACWGLGVAVDEDGYGMGGSGGAYAGWSHAGGYAFAFLPGTMGSHDRALAVENALRACVGCAPL